MLFCRGGETPRGLWGSQSHTRNPAPFVQVPTHLSGRGSYLEALMPEPERDSLPFDVQPWDALIAAEELIIADLTERLADAQRMLAIDREQREIAIANGT